MSSGNKHPYPLLITLGAIAGLAAISFGKPVVTAGNHTLRPMDIFADLRTPDPVMEPAADTALLAATDPAGGLDSLQRAPLPPRDYLTYPGILDYGYTTGPSGSGMHHFMEALRQLRTGSRKKVRIAYFGDSMIEGDLITMDLRDSLQSYFGGEGVGFVPATSVVSGFRTTITHSFSPNWTDYHFKNSPPAGVELGISGHAFVPAPESWVRFSPVKRQRLDEFGEVSILYGKGSGKVRINDRPADLQGIGKLNSYSFYTDSATRSLTFKFPGNQPLPLYGVCFESREGIFLDNYSFRGISGVELGKLSSDMWKQVQSVRPYDLIVLHYGANVLFMPENTRFDWYERPMEKVVDSLRRYFPQSSFLIVGTADKAYRKNGRYVTAPGVKALLKVQHEFAEEKGLAYWNLYTAMGGDGAMARWVEGEQALANKDYTHFNFRGASRVGALLYKAIMDEFRQEAM
ncbi:hypothetical protein WJU16_10535 [Chitinophaga pollutisoli]|uniref:Lysophospholipase L1 n=1 Tax=Chitinophaga pollutisoli TaxID=3133966 RepID=A0ABZ2YXL4_9BACT